MYLKTYYGKSSNMTFQPKSAFRVIFTSSLKIDVSKMYKRGAKFFHPVSVFGVLNYHEVDLVRTLCFGICQAKWKQ